MIPGRLIPAPLLLPQPLKVLPALATVNKQASKTFNHVAGSIHGAALTYDDLNAFAWFAAGGWEYRGPRTAFSRRGLGGLEDGKQKKQ